MHVAFSGWPPAAEDTKDTGHRARTETGLWGQASGHPAAGGWRLPWQPACLSHGTLPMPTHRFTVGVADRDGQHFLMLSESSGEASCCGWTVGACVSSSVSVSVRSSPPTHHWMFSRNPQADSGGQTRMRRALLETLSAPGGGRGDPGQWGMLSSAWVLAAPPGSGAESPGIKTLLDRARVVVYWGQLLPAASQAGRCGASHDGAPAGICVGFLGASRPS